MNTASALVFCTAALLTACAPLPPAAPSSSANLKSEVAAFLDDYVSAVGSRDAARIRNAYVTDDRFVWIEDGKVRYRKVDEVLASLSTFPPAATIRTELKDVSVVAVGPSAAHAWATFRTSVNQGQSGFAFGGAISFVLERQGTSWKVVGGHTSSPGQR